MTKDFTICVGTIGEGVFRSPDGGETWNRIAAPFPAPFENEIRALAVDPSNPHRVLAGSNVGIYQSEDNGASWEKLDSPMDGLKIWSVAVHPDDPDTIFAGTQPPRIFRSRDRGKSWERLPADIAEECFVGPTKVTAIVFDPRDRRTVWASVEIDGVYRSLDGGDTWTHLPECGPDPLHQDVHCVAVSSGREAKILATTPAGIFASGDEGESWELHEFPLFDEDDMFSYCRGIALKPDEPSVIFVGNGNTIPGWKGAIQRTRDGGKNWAAMGTPVEPNSHIYWLATHPADPNRVVATSINGQIYTSGDAGDSWEKLKREFGEVRAIAWMPN